ncbi:hypothetical protein FGG08_006225, partial [Glutinoglossum americanum]
LPPKLPRPGNPNPKRPRPTSHRPRRLPLTSRQRRKPLPPRTPTPAQPKPSPPRPPLLPPLLPPLPKPTQNLVCLPLPPALSKTNLLTLQQTLLPLQLLRLNRPPTSQPKLLPLRRLLLRSLPRR